MRPVACFLCGCRERTVHGGLRGSYFPADVVVSHNCDECGTLLFGRCVVDDRVLVEVKG